MVSNNGRKKSTFHKEGKLFWAPIPNLIFLSRARPQKNVKRFVYNFPQQVTSELPSDMCHIHCSKSLADFVKNYLNHVNKAICNKKLENDR